MTTLFINIKELIQVRELNVMKVSGKDMGALPIIKNAFLFCIFNTSVGLSCLYSFVKKINNYRV